MKHFPLLLSFLILFSWSSPIFGQTKIDSDLNNALSGAVSLAEHYSEIAPFLSIGVMLLFEEEDGSPSYSEMRSEWEGYTNERVSQKGMEDRKHYLEGYRNRLDAIAIDIRILDSIKMKTTEAHSRNIIRGWDDIYTSVNGQVNYFASTSVEPAAPLLATLGAVIQLGISALDNLIFLTRADQMTHLGYIEKRKQAISKWNKILKEEIDKAALERTNLIVLHHSSDDYTRDEIVACDDPNEHNCLNGRKSVSVYHQTYRYWISDDGRMISEAANSDINTRLQSRKSWNNTVEYGRKESEYNSYKESVKKKFFHNHWIQLSLNDNMIIKVDFLKPQAQYSELLQTIRNFGEPIKVKMDYTSPDLPEGSYYRRTRIGPDWVADGYYANGNGYIEIWGPWGRQLIRYFHNKKDHGALVDLVDPERGFLYFQETRTYDPWEDKFLLQP